MKWAWTSLKIFIITIAVIASSYMVLEIIYLLMIPNLHWQPGPHPWFLPWTSTCASWTSPFWCLIDIPNRTEPGIPTDSTCQKNIKPALPIAFPFSVIDRPRLPVAQAKYLMVILDNFLSHSTSNPSASPVGLTSTIYITDPSHHHLPCGLLLQPPKRSIWLLPPLPTVFIFYCSVTNYYKYSTLKQHKISLLFLIKTTNDLSHNLWVRSVDIG